MKLRRSIFTTDFLSKEPKKFIVINMIIRKLITLIQIVKSQSFVQYMENLNKYLIIIYGGNGCGCPYCTFESIGERTIKEFFRYQQYKI